MYPAFMTDKSLYNLTGRNQLQYENLTRQVPFFTEFSNLKVSILGSILGKFLFYIK